MRFLISTQLDGRARRLSVSGDLDLAAGPQLAKAIDEALYDDDTDDLVIDLSATTFLDCSGVGVLVYGRNLAVRQGRGYEIQCAHGMPLKLLMITGVLDP